MQASPLVALPTSPRSYATIPAPFDEPNLTFADGLWRLRSSWGAELPSGERVTVPRGFTSDLASIPRLLWPLCAPTELSLAAALIHDYLGSVRGDVPGLARALTKADVDNVFAAVMERQRVARWRRALAFRVVRWRARAWAQPRTPGEDAMAWPQGDLFALSIGGAYDSPSLTRDLPAPPFFLPTSKLSAGVLLLRLGGWMINRRRQKKGKDYIFPISQTSTLGSHIP